MSKEFKIFVQIQAHIVYFLKHSARFYNYGRYCAQDPEQDFSRGYNGKDVVFQNLRQACFLKVANENGKPWLWWDYVTDFAIRCSMKEKKYNKDCSDQVIKSLDRLKTSCEYISLDSLHKRLFILFIYIYIYIVTSPQAHPL